MVVLGMALGEYTCKASLRMPPGNEDSNKVWLLFTMASSTFGIVSVPLKRQVSKKEMDKKISHPKAAFPLSIGDEKGEKEQTDRIPDYKKKKCYY